MSPLKREKIYLENMSQRLVKGVGGYSGEEQSSLDLCGLENYLDTTCFGKYFTKE